MDARRTLVLGLLSAATIPLAGCATELARGRPPEGPYCYRNSRRKPVVCTTNSTPGLAVEEEAKRFEPDPRALTVYVVRSSWGDNHHLVKLTIAEHEIIELVPYSMARLRLEPGMHQVAFEVDGKRHARQVSGDAGDMRYLRIGGEFWVWGSTYGWTEESAASIRNRALRARLVADVSLA